MRKCGKGKGSLPQRRLLASAIGLAMASWAGAGMAAQSGEAVELGSVTVNGQQEDGYKVDKASSPKYSAPLLDTPQTITVVPRAVIEEQNALSLRQVLSNVSGITFAAGEGGGGLGDSINIRGFGANNSIQIDGLRDSAQTTRNDSFNLEAVEVIKGPSSTYGGAGATGGVVNLVSKTPEARAFNRASVGLGTDNYQRLTADLNQPLDELEGAALRLNLMGHQNEVAGREHIDLERWGVAPSLSFGMDGPTRLTLSYFRQSDKNLPDYGLPARNGEVLAGVDRDNYYGFHNIDTEETDVDAFTVEFEHDFNDRLSFSNLARYMETQRLTVVSASHINVSGQPVGRYVPAGPQGHGRDYDTSLAINQSNLTWRFNTGPLAHTLVSGLEVSREDYARTTFTHGLDFSGRNFDIFNPPGYYTGPTNKQDTARVEAQLDGEAVYLFDTIALNEQWDLSAGLRYDHVEGEAKNASIAAVPGYGNQYSWSDDLESSDEVVSSRLGLVYKPADNGRIYLAWGNSFNPSAEDLASRGAGLAANNQDLDPEENETWELGTKWELLDQRLALNAAIFRVTKTNGRVANSDPLGDPIILDGKQRVDGLELGVSGKLSARWDVFANYTYLDSEIIKAAAADVAQEGQALANTPPHSFSLWSTYQLAPAWELGYGAQYVGKRNVTNVDTAKVAEYWVHSAMLGYQVSDALELQLNVRNLFDEEYYDRIRGSIGTDARSSALVPGEGRTAILAANFSF
ncbi:TonB-dependent siderophore receptor [Pseudomonas lalucatii]|uniref:TonB-dependent siderophore receptor n=1 Tax=Pseudomonas lalucatii TaxID=1424203 RepID=A0ABS5Q5B2_9PSED|nr:TonB-dependent siderophore receptor [Pseudomonas lalucatii]MBS7663892.1 TonB-dependent siderophore receptor [Pseudomonas lalucatii]MBS7725274.1 TonB-dependent siderophore receptor [Pseudomonas lalucatii]QVM86767.1 TonB-dependent siderophore receptor [Pseudomonas lalucatii]